MADDSALRTRASLLVRLRRGAADPSAWREFVQRYGPLVLDWCRRWGLQQADAEDVTQDVLLKLAGRLRAFEYDPTRRFRGLLWTIAQGAWSDLQRARGRAVPGSGDSAVAAALESAPARDDLAARLQAGYERELFDLAVAEVRARVEAQTWEAFRLTALEGRSGVDAASALGVQVAAVYKARSRVQQMLRAEVARLEERP
jgi:RNA polymerase sigma-70 factor (ECF subfamily)